MVTSSGQTPNVDSSSTVVTTMLQIAAPLQQSRWVTSVSAAGTKAKLRGCSTAQFQATLFMVEVTVAALGLLTTCMSVKLTTIQVIERYLRLTVP